MMSVQPTPILPCWLTLQTQQKINYYQLRLWVQPSAKVTQVTDIVFDTHHWVIKLRLAAPPIDGKANEALVRWLAKNLDCSKQAIKITSGTLNRHKTVLILANDVELTRLLTVFT